MTGFGPIGLVTFRAIQEVDLDEGSASNTLTLNTSVPTLAVDAFGNGGDDIFNVSHVGQAMFLDGGTGQDTVNVTIAGAPASRTDLLNLSLQSIAHLVVDNTANSGAVNWEVENGDTLGFVQSGAYTALLPLNGAGDATILAGLSSANTLNMVANAGPVNGTNRRR